MEPQHAEAPGLSAAGSSAARPHGFSTGSGNSNAPAGSAHAEAHDAAAAWSSNARGHALPDTLATGHDAAATEHAPGNTKQHHSKRPAGITALPQISQLPAPTTAGPHHPKVEPTPHGCFHQTENGKVPSQPATTAAAGTAGAAAAEPTGHDGLPGWNAGHVINGKPGAQTGDFSSAATSAAGRATGHDVHRSSKPDDECCSEWKPPAVPQAADVQDAANAVTGRLESGPWSVSSPANRASKLLPALYAAANDYARRRGTHGPAPSHVTNGATWYGRRWLQDPPPAAHAPATADEAADGLSRTG